MIVFENETDVGEYVRLELINQLKYGLEVCTEQLPRKVGS